MLELSSTFLNFQTKNLQSKFKIILFYRINTVEFNKEDSLEDVDHIKNKNEINIQNRIYSVKDIENIKPKIKNKTLTHLRSQKVRFGVEQYHQI